jgi:hypothetical protein
MSTIHVRYDGESHDLDFESLFTEDRLASIGVASVSDVNSNTVTSDNVKTAVSQHFDVGVGEFEDYQVEFHKNGNITVRPDAVFGE